MEKWLISRTWAGNIQDEPGTSSSARKYRSAKKKTNKKTYHQQTKQNSHNDGDMSKEYKNPLKELSTAKAEAIGACTGL